MEFAVDVLKPEKSPYVTYVRNERTAGLIPVWNAPDTKAAEEFDAVLSSYQSPEDHAEIKDFVTSPALKTKAENRFGFGDIIDMVNPLQHIPLVSFAYRKITGDHIKPISTIIGGGIYGGAAGAAGGLVKLVMHEEDVLGYATAFSQDRPDSAHKVKDQKESVEYAAYHDLPVHLLSLAEIPMPEVFEGQQSARVA